MTLTHDDTDDFTDELVRHLRSRRDAAAADVDVPDLDDLLHSTAATSVVALVPRRRFSPATIALAVAAVLLLLVGVIALTRDGHQRVSTQPAGPSQQLLDAGLPLLFPDGDESAVSASITRPGSWNVDVAATVETYVRGEVGQEAHVITLIAVDSTDAGSVGVFSSMRPSTTFDPTAWFADPASVTSVAATPTDGGYDLIQWDIRGADRAVIADAPDRADVLALKRGDVEVALFGVGTAPGEIAQAAAQLVWGTGRDVRMSDQPGGYSPLLDRATSAASVASVSVNGSSSSFTATHAAKAALVAAETLSNTGAALPRFTVLRGAPDWVLQGPSQGSQVHGRRNGAWISLRPSTTPVDGATALRMFDSLHSVDAPTFDAALARGDRRAAASVRKGNAKVAHQLEVWGGWLPVTGRGEALINLGQSGSTPPTVGGMTGLKPLWNPTTGATIGFADVEQPPLTTEDLGDVLVESQSLAGRPTELRRWSADDPGLHAVFADRSGTKLRVDSTGFDAEALDAIVAGLVEGPDGSWTMTVPAGFEPLPFARAIDAAASRAAGDERGREIDGTILTIGDPADVAFYRDPTSAPAAGPPGVTFEISKIDPDIYGDIAAQFFLTAPVERMTTGGQTWYRRRVDGGHHSVMIPGTATRPMIVVSAAGRTDDELFDLATTVRPAGDDEVEHLFATYGG